MGIENGISENNSSISEEDEVGNRNIMEGESQNLVSWFNRVDYPGEDTSKVIIIDAMAIAQTIKKTPTMKKMSDFCDVFCKKIQRLAKPYTESRVVFDEYFDNSLKEKTRAKRAESKKCKKPKVQISK